VAIACIVVSGGPARAAGYEPGTPYTYLFDTGAKAADPLSAAAVRDKTGWNALAEDDLTHQFAGDAAVANDRLIIVLRSKAPGAEVYAQTASGLVQQATIRPTIAAGGAASLSAVRIVENNPAAVMVEAALQTGGGSIAKLTWRLTTGQTFVELRPGDGVEKVRIESPSRYIAVPDFFGDDMVFTAESIAGPRLGLPAEHFFLQFADRGNALLMCVWPSGRQQAAALLGGEGSQRTIQGSELQCIPGKSLWVAALVAPGIWHEHVLPLAQAPRETVLDWRPPFPAKWRASLAGTAGIGPSWYFRSSDDADEAAGPAGERSPCCLDAQRALVRLPAEPVAPKGSATSSGPQSLVVYPIDRNRTTPLGAFCPIDILRATLGVGPCQYILQTEGLASDSNPTPDSVMTWVEKQFDKKKEKKAAEEIREVLAQMVGHVEHVDQRIGQYAVLAREVRALCPAQAGNPAAARATDSLRLTLDYLEHALSAASGPAQPAERARKLADEIAGLVGKDNARTECRRLGIEVRRLGAIQDRTLANCRMASRWLGQQASMTAAQAPDDADSAGKIQARIEKVLQRK
jgi:hypothetical protein